VLEFISDKPIPLRAWAAFPASYLAINEFGTTSNGSPVRGENKLLCFSTHLTLWTLLLLFVSKDEIEAHRKGIS
jgi:hypothetical protein